jgi:hypothetical protein
MKSLRTTEQDPYVINTAIRKLQEWFNGGRKYLTANTTYYVRTDGSNANDGSANDATHAFLTLQGALDYIKRNIDDRGYTITVSLANGTYSSRTLWGGYWGAITITGSSSAILDCATTDIDTLNLYQCKVTLDGGITIKNSAGGAGLGNAFASGDLADIEIKSVTFGQSQKNHIDVSKASEVFCETAYTISGSAGQSHIEAYNRGGFETYGIYTVTLTGTPNFGTAFAVAGVGGIIINDGVTFSGAATGTRYSAYANGVIETFGSGANYFPGNVAGTTATGGQYN